MTKSETKENLLLAYKLIDNIKHDDLGGLAHAFTQVYILDHLQVLINFTDNRITEEGTQEGGNNGT